MRTVLACLLAGCSLVPGADLEQALVDAVTFEVQPLATPAGVNGCGTTTLRFTAPLVFAGDEVVVQPAIGEWTPSSVTLTLEDGGSVAIGTVEVDTTSVPFQDQYEASLQVSHTGSEASGVVPYTLRETGPRRFSDADGDGSGALPIVRDCDASMPLVADDCDDDDPLARPGAIETIADGIDQDCDGSDLCYRDADSDGVGGAATMVATVQGCAVAGSAATSGDCDDGDARVAPGLPEVCDGLDNDCSGSVDTDEADIDGDLFVACSDFEAGAHGLMGGDDCDDEQPQAHLQQAEQCDGIDNDCDGHLLPGELDPDHDGFVTCTDFVDIGIGLLGTGDCEPDHDEVWPGAPELCDGIDNDCDLLPDPFEIDTDLDHHVACEAPLNGLLGGDCDDGDSLVYPGAPEHCDGVRNDCSDAGIDDGAAPFSVRRGDWVVHEGTDFGAALAAHDAEDSGTLHLCADAGSANSTFPIDGAARLMGHGMPLLTGRFVVTGGDELHLRGLRLAPATELHADTDGGMVSSDAVVVVTDSILDCAHSPGVRNGGAIHAQTRVTLVDSEVRGCQAIHGGAIHAKVVTLDHSRMLDNNAENGGGIYATDGFVATHSRFESNHATSAGGAAYVDGVVNVNLTDSDFLQNSADEPGGGGLFLGSAATDGQLTITRGTWDSNSATHGGAIYASDSPLDLQMQEVTLTDNTVSGHGGGLYTAPSTSPGSGATGTITGGLWSRNSSDRGGGLYVSTPGWSVVGTEFRENLGVDRGGAIRVAPGGTLATDHVRFIDNQGGIGRDLALGGPVSLVDTDFLVEGTPTFGLSRVSSNSAIDATRLHLQQGPDDSVALYLLFPIAHGPLNGTLACTECSFGTASIQLSNTVDSTLETYVYDGPVLGQLHCDAMAQTCEITP